MSGDRDNRAVTYLDDSTLALLKETAENTGKSQAEVMRHALREYLDRDHKDRVEERLQRIEEKIDTLGGASSDESTHTHKHTETTNTATDRRINELLNEHLPDEKAFPDRRVEQAVKNGLGYTDDRTVKKYRRLFKERALLYQHPNGKIWYRNRKEWFEVALYAPRHGFSEKELFEQYPDEVHNEFVDWMEENGNVSDSDPPRAVADGGADDD